MSKDNKQKKVEPFIPLPFRKGCKIIKKYEEDFVDAVGNEAVITYCDFIDQKNKLQERFTLYIKWKEIKQELSGKELEEFLESFKNVIEELKYNYYDGFLSYFFKYNDKYHLAYWMGGTDVISDRYVVFELKNFDNIENFAKEYFDIVGFEEIINYLNNNYVNNYYLVNMLLYKDIVYCNKKAEFIFNVFVEKTIKYIRGKE